jgi:hypothetical protein
MSFIVNTDGKLLEPKVLRDIEFGTGVEAIRLINEAKLDSRKNKGFSSAFLFITYNSANRVKLNN